MRSDPSHVLASNPRSGQPLHLFWRNSWLFKSETSETRRLPARSVSRSPLAPSIGAVHWNSPLELSIGNHRAEVANAWRRHAFCAALASSKRLEAVASIFSLTRSHGRLTHGRLCESVGYFSLTRQRKLSAVMYRVFPSGPKVQLLVRPPVINRPSSLP